MDVGDSGVESAVVAGGVGVSDSEADAGVSEADVGVSVVDGGGVS